MNKQLSEALKKHNEQRIAEYRDLAIELLQQIQEESQTDLYFQACKALALMQAYLNLSADNYPIDRVLREEPCKSNSRGV
jgi:hypothetical protein